MCTFPRPDCDKEKRIISSTFNNTFPLLLLTHKTSSYITSSYKTSSYQTLSSYRTSMIPNVQDTKRPVTKRPVTKCPGYKTSRTQNFQFFVNLKTCLKNTRGLRPGILDAVHALRPARSDVVVKPTSWFRHQ
jgi:hypothetical protein